MIVSDTIFSADLGDTGKSKYKALAQAIRSAIVTGTLTPGAQMPTVRALAWHLKVTPGTVARAYGLLTEEGRLVAEVGRGTFVAGRAAPPPATDSLLHAVDELHADFRSSRVPDVGQGAVIDAALVRLGQGHARRHIDYPTPASDHAARVAVATHWIDAARLGPVSADDIVLGNGAQNCCLMALQAVLRGPTPVILTEDLSYPGVRHAARLLRAQLVGVPMDGEGLLPDALAAAARRHGAQVLITAAEVHSPTTVRTTAARKAALAAVAAAHDLAIIEDDCHGIAPTDVPAYRLLVPERACFISSLTKSVSGSLRFGYMVAAAGQARALRQVAQSSFYGVAQPIVDLCTDLLVSGAAQDIRDRVIARIAQRVAQTQAALGHWDMAARPDAAFVWLAMPQGWRASGFALACERRGIMVRPGDEFALGGERAPNAVRLSLSTCEDDALFARALATMDDLLHHPEMLIDG